MIFLFVLHLFFSCAGSYSILGIFPLAAKSHHIVFDSLMVELVNRGHNVTVYNTFAKNHSLPNYREIDISRCFPMPSIFVIQDLTSKAKNNFWDSDMVFQLNPSYEEITNCEPLMKLVNSTDRFDILITELFNTEFFISFGHKFGIPSIVFHANSPNIFHCERIGLPYNPSYIPNLYSGYSPAMGFVERLHNSLYYWYSSFAFHWYSRRKYDAIGRKIFGSDLPKLRDLATNTSLMFSYMHFSLNHARPLTPNVIEVGGLNIKADKPLPQVCIIIANYVCSNGCS